MLRCARLIDLAEGNRPQRGIEAADFVRHTTEGHAAWLEVLDIPARTEEARGPGSQRALEMPNTLGRHARRIQGYRCADFPVHPATLNASILIVPSRTSPFTRFVSEAVRPRGSASHPSRRRLLHTPETAACYQSRRARYTEGRTRESPIRRHGIGGMHSKDDALEREENELATRHRARSGRLVSDGSACATPQCSRQPRGYRRTLVTMDSSEDFPFPRGMRDPAEQPCGKDASQATIRALFCQRLERAGAIGRDDPRLTVTLRSRIRHR